MWKRHISPCPPNHSRPKAIHFHLSRKGQMPNRQSAESCPRYWPLRAGFKYIKHVPSLTLYNCARCFISKCPIGKMYNLALWRILPLNVWRKYIRRMAKQDSEYQIPNDSNARVRINGNRNAISPQYVSHRPFIESFFGKSDFQLWYKFAEIES